MNVMGISPTVIGNEDQTVESVSDSVVYPHLGRERAVASLRRAQNLYQHLGSSRLLIRSKQP